MYLKPYFYAKPNVLKYNDHLISNNETTLVKLSKFVDIIMKRFASYLLVFKRLRREIIPVNIEREFHFYYSYVICHFNHVVENFLYWKCTIAMSYTDSVHVLHAFLLHHLRVA